MDGLIIHGCKAGCKQAGGGHEGVDPVRQRAIADLAWIAGKEASKQSFLPPSSAGMALVGQGVAGCDIVGRQALHTARARDGWPETSRHTNPTGVEGLFTFELGE